MIIPQLQFSLPVWCYLSIGSLPTMRKEGKDLTNHSCTDKINEGQIHGHLYFSACSLILIDSIQFYNVWNEFIWLPFSDVDASVHSALFDGAEDMWTLVKFGNWRSIPQSKSKNYCCEKLLFWYISRWTQPNSKETLVLDSTASEER